MLPLSGKTISVAVLTYYCNRSTNYELRQGPLFLLNAPKEFEDFLLLGPADWDTNLIQFNLNLSHSQTPLAAELDIEFGSPKECFADFYGWLMDNAPSTLRDIFGRFKGEMLEANEPVGNGVPLAEWAKKTALKYGIELRPGPIRTVAMCSDCVLAYQH